MLKPKPRDFDLHHHRQHRRIIWLWLFSLMVTLGCFTSSQALTLVEGGRPRAVIITANQPTPTAQLAAEELVWHLRKATGVELAIMRESDAVESPPNRIYVGACRAATEAGIEVEQLTPDDAVLRVVGKRLFLLGKENEEDPLNLHNGYAGTLFAVYELLEAFLDVRWLWPGDLGTSLPKKSTVEVPSDLNTVTSPVIRHRHVWGANVHLIYRNREKRESYLHDLKLFMRRHRLGWSEVIEDPAHSFQTWWDTYGKEHPEWFSIDPEDQRAGVGMDVANPELHRFIVDEYQQHSAKPVRHPVWTTVRGQNWFRLGEVDHPWLPSLSKESLAWDGPLQQCPPFSAGLYKSFGAHHVADRYARFYQTIYEMASRKDPDVKVSGFLYWSYLMAPTKPIKISPNVYGNFAPWSIIDTGIVHFPLDEEALAWTKAQWTGWKNTGMSMVYRPNHWHSNYVMPHLERQGAEFFQWAYHNGMVGFKFDRLMDQWASRSPTLYLYFRLFADPTRKIDTIMEEYYDAFGSAAKEIKQYVDYWEAYAQLRHAPVKLPPGIMTGETYAAGPGLESLVPNPLMSAAATAEVFPPAVFAPALEILDRAAQAAKADPTGEAEQRVAFLRIGLDHALLTSEFWAEMEVINAGEAKLPDDPERRLRAEAAFVKMEDFRHQHGDSNAINFGEASVHYEKGIKDVQELRKQYNERKAQRQANAGN